MHKIDVNISTEYFHCFSLMRNKMTLFYVCISKLNSRIYKTRMVRVFNDESYIIVISRYLSKEVFSPTKTFLTTSY